MSHTSAYPRSTASVIRAAAVVVFAGAALTVPCIAEDFRVQLDTIHSGYDGIHCWVHPRAGVVPNPNGPPTVVLTMMQLWLKGSDVFGPLNEMRTDDLGRTWSGPHTHADTLGPRSEGPNITVTPNDFTPKWHSRSGRLLAIGQTARYEEKNGVRKLIPVRAREVSYAVYDPVKRTWSPWAILVMPDPVKFYNAGAGSVQRVDLPNGDILLPVYVKTDKAKKGGPVVVLRCGFDGTTLTVKEVGSDVSVPSGREVGRGLGEPSLIQFGKRFHLTLRNDHDGYVASSDDGLHFDPPRSWNWDDGTSLGNYNTQQHWVAHRDKLYLVYTRKGANNDHVFRHRAPLFMAQVDPKRLVVLRATERILVPERGARLGNFGVTEVNENETWVTVAEWMQTWGPNVVMPVNNKYGSNNSVYVARILWKTPAAGEP